MAREPRPTRPSQPAASPARARGRRSSPPLACRPLAAVALTTALPLVWALAQIATRSEPTAVAFVGAACAVLGFAGAIGLLTHRIGRPAPLALTLVLPAPLSRSDDIAEAVQRAADLWPAVGNVAVWIAGLAIAAAVGVAAYAAGRRIGLPGRLWPAVLGAVLGFFALSVSLFPLQGSASDLGLVVEVLAAGAALVLLASGWRQLEVALVATGLCLAALAALPAPYAGLYDAFAGAALGAGALAARVAWARRRSTRLRLGGGARGDGVEPTPPDPPSPAPPASDGGGSRRRRARLAAELAALTALCAAAIVVASVLVDRAPSVWRDHPRQRGLLGALVRLGQRATDLDRDGQGTAFGHHDCEPFDARVQPGAHERPGDALDEDCRGGAEPAGTAARLRRLEAINPPPPPLRRDLDVVLVVVDTLRFDDALERTLPTLSAFVREGFVFTRAYATSSFTSLSLGALLAGRLPASIPLEWESRFNAHPREPPGGLGPWLRALGWDTALAGAVHEEENLYFARSAYGHGFRIRSLGDVDEPPERTTDRALGAWRQLDPDGPRFLWVHYMWVHQHHEREAYVSSIAQTDAAIGRLRRALGSDALWIVTSDHGEEFGEHGGTQHAQTLYEEVTHVPLFIHVPGRPGSVVDRVSPLRSVPATVMASLRPELAPEGRGPYLCLGQTPCRDVPAPMALEMQHVHLHGLVTGAHQVIRDIGRGRLEAFDLRRDPAERSALQLDSDPAASALLRRLTRWEQLAFGPRSDEHWWPYRPEPFVAD